MHYKKNKMLIIYAVSKEEACVMKKNIISLQIRDFDLHNAMRMAYDTEHLKTVLEKATEAEIREFVQSIRQDCKDIEDVITKLITRQYCFY